MSATEIHVDEFDCKMLLDTVQQLDVLHRKLGELRRAYLSEERSITVALDEVEHDLRRFKAIVGSKYLAHQPGKWELDPQKKAYVRVDTATEQTK